MSDTVTTITPPPADASTPDSWIRHVGRYLGVSWLVGFSCIIVVGVVWTARILDRTGYRRRDWLLMFVPVVGMIVSVRSMWRYTARDAYRSPRGDRPSTTMAPRRQVGAAVAGYGLAAVYYALLGVAIVAGWTGWAEADRVGLVSMLESEGVDPLTARCVLDELEVAYPGGAPAEWDGAFQSSFEDAWVVCSSAT